MRILNQLLFLEAVRFRHLAKYSNCITYIRYMASLNISIYLFSIISWNPIWKLSIYPFMPNIYGPSPVNVYHSILWNYFAMIVMQGILIWRNTNMANWLYLKTLTPWTVINQSINRSSDYCQTYWISFLLHMLWHKTQQTEHIHSHYTIFSTDKLQT